MTSGGTALPGRLTAAALRLALVPVVAVLDVAIGVCDRRIAARRAPGLIAVLEDDLRRAAADW